MKTLILGLGPISFLLLSTLACTGLPGEEGGDGDGDGDGDGTFTGGAGTGGGSVATGGTGPGAGGGVATGGAGTATGGSVGAGGTTAGTGGSGSNDCTGLSDILSESQFNSLFPDRNGAYTYQGMIDAVDGTGDLIGFPLFAAEGSCDTRKREVAAFLANVARETGQLVYIEQINKSDDYCDEGQAYGCPAGTYEYFGRGPIQLSWNYNYRAASMDLFGDERLLQDPDIVAENPAVAWATGFWFWMIGGAGGDGSYSPHSAMVDELGFGTTIDIINGSQECDGNWVEAVSVRVCFYKKYAAALGVTLGPGSLDCGVQTNEAMYCDGI